MRVNSQPYVGVRLKLVVNAEPHLLPHKLLLTRPSNLPNEQLTTQTIETNAIQDLSEWLSVIGHADEFDEADLSGVDLHGYNVCCYSTISTPNLEEDFHNRQFEMHAQKNLARTMSWETYGRIDKTELRCG